MKSFIIGLLIIMFFSCTNTETNKLTQSKSTNKLKIEQSVFYDYHNHEQRFGYFISTRYGKGSDIFSISHFTPDSSEVRSILHVQFIEIEKRIGEYEFAKKINSELNN